MGITDKVGKKMNKIYMICGGYQIKIKYFKKYLQKN